MITEWTVSPDTYTPSRGCFIYKNIDAFNSVVYLYKDGSEHGIATDQAASDVFFDSAEEAESFLTAFNVPGILPDDKVDDWREEKVRLAIAESIEFLMQNKMTFSRHDVIRAVRQLFGAGVKVEYADWKETVVDFIEAHRVAAFDYTKAFSDGRLEYVYISTEDDEPEDEPENDNAEPDVKERTKQVVPAAAVRAEGLKPGDIAYCVAVRGGIYFAADETTLATSLVEDDVDIDDITFAGSYKVDKYCNIQFSKNIFIAADLENIWGTDINWITK